MVGAIDLILSKPSTQAMVLSVQSWYWCNVFQSGAQLVSHVLINGTKHLIESESQCYLLSRLFLPIANTVLERRRVDKKQNVARRQSARFLRIKTEMKQLVFGISGAVLYPADRCGD